MKQNYLLNSSSLARCGGGPKLCRWYNGCMGAPECPASVFMSFKDIGSDLIIFPCNDCCNTKKKQFLDKIDQNT